jgi:hypothetical protein
LKAGRVLLRHDLHVSEQGTTVETIIKAAWATLALIHLAPAAALVAPSFLQTLYGVDSQGEVGILLTHRGGLFLAVVAACTLAIFDPGARRAASLVACISVVGFLLVYGLAGRPSGSLRTIALVDLLALLPLGVAAWTAWHVRTVRS